MIAPIDSKVTVEVGGETIALRLNFRTMTLAKKAGVNLMGGGEMDIFDISIAVRCLAVEERPEMTDEEAFAIAVRGGEPLGKALAELFTDFAGQASSAEGNGKPKAKPQA